MLNYPRACRRSKNESKPSRQGCLDNVKKLFKKITGIGPARRYYDLEAQYSPVPSPHRQERRKVFVQPTPPPTPVASTARVQPAPPATPKALPQEVESQNDEQTSFATNGSGHEPQIRRDDRVEPEAPEVEQQATNSNSDVSAKPGRKSASRVRFAIPQPGLSPKQKERIIKVCV